MTWSLVVSIRSARRAAISRAWRHSRQGMAMAGRASNSIAFAPRGSTRAIFPQPGSCRGSTTRTLAGGGGFPPATAAPLSGGGQGRGGPAWNEGRFARSVISVKDVNGLTILAKDEHMRPSTTMQSLARLNPSFVQLGEMSGFDAVAVQAHPELETINHVHHAGKRLG